ncbi:MAG: patatin-like phospholipase family protein [Gammaproteobacteria bacterium]|nr:patatin-like phospholipase family protein [Gammaproteobacteria bacterium]
MLSHSLIDSLKRWFPHGSKKHSLPGLVLALGGGGARGLAHIGVLQVLAEHSIPVRAIAGTSIGAEIGAFIASGMPIEKLTQIATEVDWIDTLRLFMPDVPGGGLISGKNIIEFLDTHLGDLRIEDLALPFIAIAADLESGAQVVIDSGRAVDAIRASISLPGIMVPHVANSYHLIDGGVVNPLPFDIARERFGGPVVAIAVDITTQRQNPAEEPASQWPQRISQLLAHSWIQRSQGLRQWLEERREYFDKHEARAPRWSMRQVIDRANDIRQSQIVALRAQLSPPDLVLTPAVGQIGTLEFYQAGAAISAGRDAALAQLTNLQQLAKQHSRWN